MENWKMNKIISGLFIGISILMISSAVAYVALTIPDVHVSYSTNDCVEVVNWSDTKYSCENMPKKYNHVWVK